VDADDPEFPTGLAEALFATSSSSSSHFSFIFSLFFPFPPTFFHEALLFIYRVGGAVWGGGEERTPKARFLEK
jgi:hypothetical protein